MKRTLRKMLTLALCGAFLACPLNVSAEVEALKPLVIDTELFHYDSEVGKHYETGDPLVVPIYSDATKANFMITGVFEVFCDPCTTEIPRGWNRVYTVTPMNMVAGCPDDGNRGVVWESADSLDQRLGRDEPLQPGDIFWASNSNGGELIAFPTEEVKLYMPYEEPCQLEYIGYGTDVLGEEFEDVILHEMRIAPNMILKAYPEHEFVDGTVNMLIPPTVTPGDVMRDGSVDIIDAIAVNKSLLSTMTLTDYGMLAADVDHNGEVNSVDALNILKNVAGLVEFEEQ